MQEIYKRLRKLQHILFEKYKVQDDIKEIPTVIETNEQVLNRSKEKYLEQNNRLERARDKIKSLRIRLDDAEKKRENYEKQMDVINTQKEYEALDKEIKDAAEKEQQLRKDILNEEKHIEELTAEIEDSEELIEIQEDELNKSKEKMEQDLRERQSHLKELENEENELVVDLDKDILFKFERIIKSKSGVGIVPIKNSVCTGCHMQLPDQFVNEVRIGKDFKFCPYCSRILYYEDEQPEEELAVQEEETGSLSDLVDLEDFDVE
ncbi:MAG: nucleic acid-binding protein [Spirochaetia bacterium]|nr:nucleic acid-binding protein [Spirochaetia bacterium]